MRLLIDGDTITYVVGYATEDIDDFRLVKTIVTRKLQYIMNTWNTYDIKIFLTSGVREHNKRFDIATIKPYKGNRSGAKPKWYKEIRQYLLDTHQAIMVTDGEADDAMGREQAEGSMIVTIDKDLLGVPGRHFDFKANRVYYSYDPGQLFLRSKRDKNNQIKHDLKGVGFKWFCAQCFLGDKVDNIPGLTGVGSKKTYELLKNAKSVGECWLITIGKFKEKKKLEQLREVAQLLWIERSNNELLRACLEGLDTVSKGY